MIIIRFRTEILRSLLPPILLVIPMLGIAEQGAVEVERQRPSLEIKRSSQQALTPNQTPDTAFSETEAEPAPLSVDERPLWKLFNAGRIDDLEAEIEHLRREYPGWEPPKTLVQLMQPKPAADTGLGPAWELFNQGKTAQAESRFRSALDKHPANTEARYGLALILFQQKRLADADRLLAGSKVDRDRALLADIRMARARHAHQAGHYRQSNRWLRQVRALGAGGREAVLLEAWNHFSLGNETRAVDGFLQAYRMRPSRDAAEGLALALTRSDRWQELTNLALELNGPLAEQERRYRAERLASRGLYLASYELFPDRDEKLLRLDSPWAAIGWGKLDKDGDSGTSKLSIERTPELQAEWRKGSDRFGVSLARVKLKTGVASRTTQLGSHNPILAWNTTPNDKLDAGVEPRLWWHREGWQSLYAEFGLTPTNARLSSKPVGKLGLVQQIDDGNWKAELSAQPVRETMLSYVGAIDPYTGESWGRVRKFALSFSGYRSLNEDWGVSGGLEAAAYRGSDVADNHSLSLNAGLSHDLKFKGFDYFSIGPELGLQGFEDNLSHYTLGHGGYFSPQHRLALGISAAFQASSSNFAIRGRLYGGWTHHYQKSSPCFPLGAPAISNCTQQYESVEDRGRELNGLISGVFRLSDHTQLLFGASARTAPEFQDSMIFTGLRINLEARPSVNTSDLPENWLNGFY